MARRDEFTFAKMLRVSDVALAWALAIVLSSLGLLMMVALG